MRSPRRRFVLFLAAAFAALASGTAQTPSEDPLAAEIARWRKFAATYSSSGEIWKEVQDSARTGLAEAAQAFQNGQRELALQKLISARLNLVAVQYLDARPPSDLDTAGFEAEWKRMGEVLRADLTAPKPDALSGIRPAVARALAETAYLQIRVFYDAGLDYGRNTMTKYGLYYVGGAEAQRDFVELAGTMLPPSPKPLPELRSLGPELDALEDRLLALYVPPASIDRHPDFITASAALKEARELEAAGFRYGALYKYLQAAQRLSAARNVAGVSHRLDAFARRLDESPLDSSIGRLYLEIARADLAAASPDRPSTTAAAIADDVLPRYFTAIAAAPRPSPTPRPPAEVTVTLVRWPYT